MDSRNGHRWTITSIDNPTPHQGGSAATRSQAWLAALAAGRTALLSCRLDTLAVSVDGQLEALLDPGRNAAGVPDAAAVTAELLQMYQSATAEEVLEGLMPGA